MTRSASSEASPLSEPLLARAVVDALPNPLIVVDEDERICLANVAAESYFQSSSNFLLRHKLGDLVPFSSPVFATVTQARDTSGVVNEYAITVGTPRLMSQGTLSPTGNDLDIAIRGEGFFKIQMPDGSYAYTRDGSFTTDQQGRIVNAQGNPVQPTITIPQNSSDIVINAQGQVSVKLPGQTTPSTIGQIGLTRFVNKTGLQPIGDNLFTETPASGPPQDGTANVDGFGDMQQSSLEQANVEVVSEISDLIAAQRAYEMNAKVISAADQMLQSTANLFR